MEYKEALNYLMAIPMFQNVGKSAYNHSLSPMTELCEAIGNPQKSFSSIHIAGTNGKGSVSSLLATTFQHAGLKTALFTSPHLVDFRERMRIDWGMIPEEDVVEFFNQYLAVVERFKPSFFELTTTIAFWWFAKESVDIAVIECGLGGSYDATNIIKPLVSVITNISKDHISILGSSLEEIAKAKAGIIKLSTPVVIGEWDIESSLEIIATAKECDSEFYIASQRYQQLLIERVDNSLMVRYQSLLADEQIEVKTNLLGSYQAKNIATALTVLDVLGENSSIKISKNDIERAFLSVPLQGRWQQVSSAPRIICDVGHNEAGIGEVVENLAYEKYKKLIFVLGVVNDKDISAILSLLPKDAEYIFTKSSVARALNPEELKLRAQEYSLCGEVALTVEQAVKLARTKASADDLIFIGGSCFTVADALKTIICCK